MLFIKLVILILLSFNSFALTGNQINNLDLLNKTWNVGKMFHSGACDLNWDDALLNSIPEIIQATDDHSFNIVINSLLDSLGNNLVSNEPLVETPELIQQEQDQTWLDDSAFDEATKNRITTIIEDFRPRENCFANIEDNQYFDEENPTSEQRLLGLFRFWGFYINPAA